MKGHPGSGKTSIARCLSEQMHIPLIDKDDARDCLTCFQSIDIAEKVDLNALSYKIMWRYAKTQLLCRNSVIVDCPLARKELFQQGIYLASQTSAAVVIVECIAADVAVWQSRLEARALSDSDVSCQHKPSSWEDLQALIKRYNGSERWSVDGTTQIEHYIHLDTTTGKCPAEIASGVIEALTLRGLFPQSDA
ncbi:g2453 [Coccomyxa elongata]